MVHLAPGTAPGERSGLRNSWRNGSTLSICCPTLAPMPGTPLRHRRGELLERPLAHGHTIGAVSRTRWGGSANIPPRVLAHARAVDRGLVLRKRIGAGNPPGGPDALRVPRRVWPGYSISSNQLRYAPDTNLSGSVSTQVDCSQPSLTPLPQLAPSAYPRITCQLAPAAIAGLGATPPRAIPVAQGLATGPYDGEHVREGSVVSQGEWTPNRRQPGIDSIHL